MAIDIKNTILTGVNGDTAFKINYNSVTDILRIDSAGRTFQPNIPAFAAYNNAAAWVNTTLGVTEVQFNSTVFNYQNCYDVNTGRFTVPADGIYVFTTSCYFSKTSSAVGDFVKCEFRVNGSPSFRRAGNGPRRIKGHGHYAGYAFDSQMQETIYLMAGDYVSVYHESSSVGTRTYRTQDQFTGALIA